MRQQRMIYKNCFRPLREVRRVFLLAMLVMGVGQVWAQEPDTLVFELSYITVSGRSFTVKPKLNGAELTAQKQTDRGISVSYQWKYGVKGAASPTINLEQTRLSKGTPTANSITTYYTLSDNMPVGVEATFSYDSGEVVISQVYTKENVKANLPKLSHAYITITKTSDTFSATLEGVSNLQPGLTVKTANWTDTKGNSAKAETFSPSSAPGAGEEYEVVCTKDIMMDGTTLTVKGYYSNTRKVVFVSGDGSDSNNGLSASSPVKTWTKAYSLLPAYTGTTDADRDAAWDSNIIVVAGSMALNSGVTESATGNRPATITGVWPWNATNTTVTKVDGGGKLTLSGVNTGCRIGADTKFKYVRFSNAGCLSLYLHDCTFDVGCLMNGAGELPTSNGALSDRKTANIQLFLLADPYAFTETSDGGWNAIMKKPVTLTMRSGKFGRILCTRITGTTEALVKQRYVVGNPEKPLLAVINVDMDPSTTEGDWNKGSYVDDIAFLCAGTTQGTVYADVQMNIKRGKISSLVAGSQGNAIAACESAGVPTSTYIGRTTVNLIGKTDADVQIYRYFGGCLGRLNGDGASGECKAYYYGHSILNLTHGTIERDLFASAGGLSGLKNPNNDTQYTTDTRIPYQGGSKPNYPYMGIDYSGYSASKTIVSVKSDLYSPQETIDLAETKITFNINGGIIKGNVYGGSYGYSEDMTAGAAPTGAGSLWGNTEVNISGGTIQGSVYAGGGGTTEYYTTSTTDAMRAKYLTVATVYGSTHLTITGKPTIGGNIYGGGGGVAATGAVGTDTEYLNIAKVYGNTNVTINADDDWTFIGNIYGGGAKGAVEGDTNVTIKGGDIIGDVYGGGYGEEGHPDKAKVTGNTSVTIQDP